MKQGTSSSKKFAKAQMVDANLEIVSRAELNEMPDSVVFQPTRAKIVMTLPKSAKLFAPGQKEFEIFSQPKEVAGFQWKLKAAKTAEHPNFLGLYLYTFPPEKYKSSYKFDVNYSIRVLNISSPKAIQRVTKNWKFEGSNGNKQGWGYSTFIETKKLLDPSNGFLQGNGIKVEVDFTVNTATLEEGNNDEEGEGN